MDISCIPESLVDMGDVTSAPAEEIIIAAKALNNGKEAEERGIKVSLDNETVYKVNPDEEAIDKVEENEEVPRRVPEWKASKDVIKSEIDRRNLNITVQ